jgi:hypothetical protein
MLVQCHRAKPLTKTDATSEYTGSQGTHNWKQCHTHLWLDHSCTKLPLAWAGLMIKRKKKKNILNTLSIFNRKKVIKL